jgi:hypothetical protein
VRGVEGFLDELRSQLKDRSFRPLPVRERMIPKAGGKLRHLGIAALRDRVVQASLKLVLEPIFEADFQPGHSTGRCRPAANQAPTGSRRTDQRVRACRLTPQVSAHSRVLEPHSAPRGAWNRVEV